MWAWTWYQCPRSPWAVGHAPSARMPSRRYAFASHGCKYSRVLCSFLGSNPHRLERGPLFAQLRDPTDATPQCPASQNHTKGRKTCRSAHPIGTARRPPSTTVPDGARAPRKPGRTGPRKGPPVRGGRREGRKAGGIRVATSLEGRAGRPNAPLGCQGRPVMPGPEGRKPLFAKRATSITGSGVSHAGAEAAPNVRRASFVALRAFGFGIFGSSPPGGVSCPIPGPLTCGFAGLDSARGE